MHQFANGYVRQSVRPPVAGGEIFDQLPGSLPPMPAHYQRAAAASAAAKSTDAGGPCPGVTVAEVLAPSDSGGPGGHVYAKDVLPPLVGAWGWADSAAAVDEPTTRCARYSTDANGDVFTVWSVGWCAPPGCPTPAPPHGPCSCDVPCSAVRLCPCSVHLVRRQQKCEACATLKKALRKRTARADADGDACSLNVRRYVEYLRMRDVAVEQAVAAELRAEQAVRNAADATAVAAYSLDLRPVDPVVQVRRTLAGVRILCDECALARCAARMRAPRPKP